MIKYRTGNDSDEANEKVGMAAATPDHGESLTQQSFSDDADINVLVKRFGIDKHPIPFTPADARYYGDFTDVPDLRAILDRVRDAQNRFMDLPPALRARFHNRSSELWDFVNDPDNGQEAVRLGLLRREETPPPEPPPKGDTL